VSTRRPGREGSATVKVSAAHSAAMEAHELKVKLPNWLSMPSESPHPRPPAFAASFHEPPRPKARLT